MSECLGMVIKKYTARGDVIGELGVIYGTPRAASIVVAAPSVLWSVDSMTIDAVRGQVETRRRQGYTELLKQCNLFSALDAKQQAGLVEMLQPMEFRQGETIVKEGDEPACWYL